MNRYYLILTGMMIVTFLPRLIPFYILRNKKIPANIKIFLSYVPAAVLGALIIPGIFSVFPGKPYISFAAGIAAFAVSCCKDNIIFSVLAAIFVSYIFLMCPI